MQRPQTEYPFPITPTVPQPREVLDQLDDVDATRARSTLAVGQLTQHHVVSKARAQGRREGYEEGVAAGRLTRVVEEDRTSPRAVDKNLPPIPVVADGYEEGEGVPVKTPMSPPKNTYEPLPQVAMTFEHRQHYTDDAYPSTRSAPDHSSTAPYAPTLPVPTIATPVKLPLPFDPAP